jgi:hypothetical protein
MKKLLFISLALFAYNLFGQSQGSGIALTNTAHLDHLYEDIQIDAQEMGIVHIYSDYPDYNWVDDGDEGTACVDDAARAAVFYLWNGKTKSDEESIRKAKRLLEFVIHMQSENGYFYNFIWNDGSINETFATSVNEANWWTWRAIWALMEGYNYYKDVDTVYAAKLLNIVEKSVNVIKENIPAEYTTQSIGGFTRPTWLPGGTAADQTSILLLGLIPYYNAVIDSVIIEYCKKLGNGLLLMQEGGSGSYPFGAFISSENTWHGWGNSQSYALLNLYQTTQDSAYLKAAIKEVKYFYDYLINKNYLSAFAIAKVGSNIISGGEDKYPQIAYTIRPMVLASLKAYEVTGDTSYALKAATIASWFYGKNAANSPMYNPENGICFDGMDSSSAINKNSGAESTIEALLSLYGIENNPYAANEFNKMIGIEDKEVSAAPDEFTLSNNYPNPFNPVTTINYSLTKYARISIVIYDVLGKKIKTLADDFYGAGSYSIVWNGRDEYGNAVSSGVYFYRITSGNFSQTKNMVLLK